MAMHADESRNLTEVRPAPSVVLPEEKDRGVIGRARASTGSSRKLDAQFAGLSVSQTIASSLLGRGESEDLRHADLMVLRQHELDRCTSQGLVGACNVLADGWHLSYLLSAMRTARSREPLLVDEREFGSDSVALMEPHCCNQQS